MAIDRLSSRLPLLAQGQKSPITEYFFWPKTDAWEALNVSIEGKDWISER